MTNKTDATPHGTGAEPVGCASESYIERCVDSAFASTNETASLALHKYWFRKGLLQGFGSILDAPAVQSEPRDKQIDALWASEGLTMPQIFQRRRIARAALALAQPAPTADAENIDVPDTFKKPGESDDAWIDRITGAQPAPAQAVEEDWRTPTLYLDRLGDALQLLCRGHRPTNEMISSWLGHTSEDLQGFCAEHAPAWAQGIVTIDAAILMAEDPTEGVEHEDAPPAQAVEASEFPRKEFDALMDHIYEYGTTAEGVQNLAKAMIRAATTTPQPPAAVPAVAIDYSFASEFSMEHNLDYGTICAMVRKCLQVPAPGAIKGAE